MSPLNRIVSLAVVAATAIVSTRALASMGGWAVVTVEKVPDAWIADRPLQLSWVVRQHGATPLAGLRPTIEARSGSRRITGATWSVSEAGVPRYRGRITFPSAGEWQVTIHSGYAASRAVLLPWRVTSSVPTAGGTVEAHLRRNRVAVLSEAERGRRMFAALGCTTCHVHRAVPIVGEARNMGPELTDRTFPPGYLARYLANPTIKPRTSGMRMPNLSLSDSNIALLVAFINSPRRTAIR